MNSVSIFLYAADVLGSLNTVLSVLFWLSILVLLFLGLCWSLSYSETGKLGDRMVTNKFWRWPVFCICLFGVVCAVIPNRSTMYAIAASQVGEQVVKSEAVQGLASDATQALQSWIKSQITPPTEKK